MTAGFSPLSHELIGEVLETADHPYRWHAVLVEEEDEFRALEPGELDDAIVSLAEPDILARADQGDRVCPAAPDMRLFISGSSTELANTTIWETSPEIDVISRRSLAASG